MSEATPRVVIGMDPHKRSVTIEIMTRDEAVVGKGRFGTDGEGYEGRGIYRNGQVDLVWILAVDGQRLVVDAGYGPTSSASDIDNLTSMVASLEFTGNAE